MFCFFFLCIKAPEIMGAFLLPSCHILLSSINLVRMLEPVATVSRLSSLENKIVFTCKTLC